MPQRRYGFRGGLDDVPVAEALEHGARDRRGEDGEDVEREGRDQQQVRGALCDLDPVPVRAVRPERVLLVRQRLEDRARDERRRSAEVGQPVERLARERLDL